MNERKTSESRSGRGARRTAAAVPLTANRSRRGGRIAAGRSARSTTVAGDEAIAGLGQLLDNLNAAREKLQLVQPNRLSDEEFSEFNRQSRQVNRAIIAARNALLGAISAKFVAELPAINEATGRLKRDLRQLKDSVEIIRAVASTLGIIENVVKLLA
jgi:hypothetical protein